MDAGGGLRVRMLGGFAVDGVDEHALGSRKARTLLRRLVAERGAALPVDVLAEVLWADRLPARPADQVGVLVARLRRVLGSGTITRTDEGYAARVAWVDVDELDARVAEAAAALADGRVSAARAAADAAIVLARGPVLPGEDGDWVIPLRRRAAVAAAAAHRIGAEAAAAAGDHLTAIVLAEHAIAGDPYDEAALRVLMRSCASAGRPGTALAAYAEMRGRLAEDLGVSPSAETERLHGELLGIEPPAAAATEVARTRALVGRDAELAALDEARAAVAGGAAVAVAVVGEAGIGKSSLVDAWVRGLSADDHLVAVGECDGRGRELPMQPIADALAGAVRTEGVAALDALEPDDATLLAEAFGIGRSEHSPTDHPIERTAGRTRLFTAVLHAFAALAGGRRTVLVVEDVHLAGPTTVAFLAFATRRGERMLVLTTRRPGGPPLAHERVVPVGPLDVTAVGALYGEQRADELLQRTGGHPLLLSAVAASEDMGTTAGEVVSLREMVDREAELLGPAAATVRAAAVLGQDVDLDLVAAVLGVPAVDALVDLEAAAAAGLLVDAERGFAFRHELVREALAAGTATARRSLLHRQAAHALAARPLEAALTIAYHARRGGDRALAADALLRAAREAELRCDVDTAESLLTEAVELVERADVLVARARVRMSRLAFDEAAADAARAGELGGGARALEVAGWIAYYQRRYDAAALYAEEGIAAAGEDEDDARAACLGLSGKLRHGAGDLAAALRVLDAAADGPAAERGLALVWRSQALLHGGRPAEALQAVDRALAGGGLRIHPFGLFHAHFARVMALGQLGRIGEAMDANATLVRAVADGGVVGSRFRARAANLRGWLLRNAGSPDDGDDANREALAITSGADGGPAGDSVAEAHYVALLDLTDGRLQAGDLSGAAELLDRLTPVDGWNGAVAWHQRHRLGVLRARLALAAGDTDTAAELAAAVADDAAGRSALRYQVLASAIVALAETPADLDAVGDVVGRLATCAGLEGWWITDRLARRFGVDGWRATAERSASALLRDAGAHAPQLELHVRAVLDGRHRPC